MAVSGAPPGDEAEEPPEHPRVPEAAPEIEARMAEVGDWGSERYNYVLYTTHLDEHIYSTAVVDVEAMQ